MRYRRVGLLSACAYKIQRKDLLIILLHVKRICLMSKHFYYWTCLLIMDSHHWESVIRGHHVYKDIWTPFIGEIRNVQQEVHNAEDRFAVAVVSTQLKLLACLV